MSESPGEQTPLFSVVRGTPTDEELAALVAVLSARTGAGQTGAGPAEPPTTSGWSAYWRAVRAPLRPGPGAWRAAGRRE
ncbi:MAG TPA: acyl-CoA carboxylase subunit epsilon [Propionibacteriaceae bacterium]|nr:acyl-CoA carboxylase subunit epsilon [Propionibacteriaceae bacterium]